MTSSVQPLGAEPEGQRVAFQSLGSGSSGNAFLIERGASCVLLDCGVGIRTLNQVLRRRHRTAKDLDAILITHEHTDHIRTLPRALGHSTPVIATAGTRSMIRIPDDAWLSIDSGKPVDVAGMSIWALSVSHDARQPCGFLIDMPEARITVLTDLGSWDERLAEPVAASDLVVLEANHDEHMLHYGPYPAYLKRRVASPVGHLSNLDCGAALASIARSGKIQPAVWLAHLSETNNRPDIATETVTASLAAVNAQLNVTSLPRRDPGPVWTPTERRIAAPWSPEPSPAPVQQLSLDGGGFF